MHDVDDCKDRSKNLTRRSYWRAWAQSPWQGWARSRSWSRSRFRSPERWDRCRGGPAALSPGQVVVTMMAMTVMVMTMTMMSMAATCMFLLSVMAQTQRTKSPVARNWSPIPPKFDDQHDWNIVIFKTLSWRITMYEQCFGWELLSCPNKISFIIQRTEK